MVLYSAKMANRLLRKIPKSLVSQRFNVAIRCLASEAGSATMPLTFGSPQTVNTSSSTSFIIGILFFNIKVLYYANLNVCMQCMLYKESLCFV